MQICRLPNGREVTVTDDEWREVLAGRARVSARGGIERLSSALPYSSSGRTLKAVDVQHRYPRPWAFEVEKSIDYAADHTEVPEGSPGVVVGLAADYNATFQHRDSDPPRVFLPGAFEHVKHCHRPILVSHREDLEVIGERDRGVLLFGCQSGLMLKAALPATKLGRAVAMTMEAGLLPGLSIGYGLVESRMVDGVLEISRAEVDEVSVAANPLAPLCRCRLVSRPHYASADHPLVRWLVSQIS